MCMCGSGVVILSETSGVTPKHILTPPPTHQPEAAHTLSQATRNYRHTMTQWYRQSETRCSIIRSALPCCVFTVQVVTFGCDVLLEGVYLAQYFCAGIQDVSSVVDGIGCSSRSSIDSYCVTGDMLPLFPMFLSHLKHFSLKASGLYLLHIFESTNYFI